MTCKVSIITVVLNGARFIDKTISSVLSQTYQNIEYIIIDGGSTDGTVESIRKYANRIAFWSSSPDSGIYDAMNKGIDAATGDYIWFINVGDEIFSNDTLSNILAGASESVDVYYGKTQLILPCGVVKKVVNPPAKLTWKSLASGRGSIPVCHQSIIIRRTIVDHYNLAYRYTADHEWMIRALQKSTRILNTRVIMSKYLLDGYTAKNLIRCWKDRFRIVYKYYGSISLCRTVCWFILVYAKRILLQYLNKLMKSTR